VLFASDLIEHDGDLRDLPLIDRKRRLAKLIGKAKRRVRHARQTSCISQKLESAQYAWRSQRERARKNSVIDGCALRC
jgi:ATP-dependent DNA ligase